MRSFPKYDLASAIDAAKKLHEHGGEATAVKLAAILGYGGTNNGAYLNRVAAARAFGLLQGEGRGAVIALTDRAKVILQPDYPETAGQAKLEAFLSVPLYMDFLKKYEGQLLPPTQGMQNALIGLGVVEKSAPRALTRLLASAEAAGMFSTMKDRMIRPTFQRSSGDEDGSDVGEPSWSPAAPVPVMRSRLLDGLIDELPQARAWSEDGLAEWLDFFERALRIHYGLPRKRGDRPE